MDRSGELPDLVTGWVAKRQPFRRTEPTIRRKSARVLPLGKPDAQGTHPGWETIKELQDAITEAKGLAA